MKAIFSVGNRVPLPRVLGDYRKALIPLGAVLVINLIVLAAVVLPLTQFLIGELGWRTALIALALPVAASGLLTPANAVRRVPRVGSRALTGIPFKANMDGAWLYLAS